MTDPQLTFENMATDTITVGNTEGRRWVWRAEPLVEDVVTFGTLPDPRDARIAELEAALREVLDFAVGANDFLWIRLARIADIAQKALRFVPEPEASMTITTEELSA